MLYPLWKMLIIATVLFVFINYAQASRIVPDFDILNSNINMQHANECKINNSQKIESVHQYRAKDSKLHIERIKQLLSNKSTSCQLMAIDDIRGYLHWEHDEYNISLYIKHVREFVNSNTFILPWSARYNILRILGKKPSADDIAYYLDTLRVVCERRESKEFSHETQKGYATTILIYELNKNIFPVLNMADNKNALSSVLNAWENSKDSTEFNICLTFLLGKIGHERVKLSLINILKNSKDGGSRTHAAGLLGKYPATKEVIKVLTDALKDKYIPEGDSGHLPMRPVFSVRMTAANSLRKLGVDVDSMNIQIFP